MISNFDPRHPVAVAASLLAAGLLIAPAASAQTVMKRGDTPPTALHKRAKVTAPGPVVAQAPIVAQAPRSPGSAPTDTTAALMALEQEPSIGEVQEAALSYFKVSQSDVSGLRSRSQSKAAVPVLELSGGYSRSDLDEDTVNQEFDPDVPWVIRGTAGDAWEVRGKLVWDLPKLIFNPETLDVISLAGLQQGLLKEVTRLFFMRRRLQFDLILDPPADQATRLSKELRLQELTALIDAQTGGWFSQTVNSRQAAARKHAPRRNPGGLAQPGISSGISSPR